MDLVTQDSYEKRHKQSTIPPALAKEKEKNRYKKHNREMNKITQKYRLTTKKNKPGTAQVGAISKAQK